MFNYSKSSLLSLSSSTLLSLRTVPRLAWGPSAQRSSMSILMQTANFQWVQSWCKMTRSFHPSWGDSIIHNWSTLSQIRNYWQFLRLANTSNKSFMVATSQYTPITRTSPSTQPNGLTLVLRELVFNFKTNSGWSSRIFLGRRTWLQTMSVHRPSIMSNRWQ